MAGRSDKTIKHYKLQPGLMLHALAKPVQEITKEDLFTYLAQCKAQRQVGNRYLNNKRICFNSFFGWLQRKKHIVYYPAAALDQIHYEKKVKKPYYDEEREVYLNASSCYHLKKYLLSRKDSNPALFVSSKSPYSRLTEHGARQILQRLGIRAGVEQVHPHRYRATAATNALNRGMPIQDVQALLGHEDISTTMKIVE